MNNARIIAAVTLLFLLSSPVSAQGTEQSECSNRTSSDHYQHRYDVDEFAIFYDLSGDNALADLTDLNNNDIPDIIEDTMLQLITMRDVLGALGFTHPFDQYRYERAGVERIYVSMRNLNGNGVAFDPPHRDTTHAEKPCVLLIGLSSELKAGNLTPAHELFHLYQYGYSVLKNSWYLEGTARWSEGLLGERSYPMGLIPHTPEDEEALFSQSYGAVAFWMAFLDAVSPFTLGERRYTDDLLSRSYVNGEQIIHDEATTHGSAAIIEILEAFDKLDRQISHVENRRQKSWPNADRSDAANNVSMLNIVYRLLKAQ
ncbi:hypothetical protein [Vreelandella nigrificans]|uniref:Peptidase MA-like domain-containing protein n=1 Tax=Vreelandella nigrificans TaxID=2042704 RepID=A0A2A4HFW3_9GAMM|nr:hypothetical protein [Halomonas nigrificans]PCF93602.1 hypothetical protein CPA45_21550 [Halomonas nigrificans]